MRVTLTTNVKPAERKEDNSYQEGSRVLERRVELGKVRPGLHKPVHDADISTIVSIALDEEPARGNAPLRRSDLVHVEREQRRTQPHARELRSPTERAMVSTVSDRHSEIIRHFYLSAPSVSPTRAGPWSCAPLRAPTARLAPEPTCPHWSTSQQPPPRHLTDRNGSPITVRTSKTAKAAL